MSKPKKAKSPPRPKIDSNWERRLQSVNDAIVQLGLKHNDLKNLWGQRLEALETNVNTLIGQMRNLDVCESEEEPVAVDRPAKTKRTCFTAWDIKWSDKEIRVAELLKILNEEISSSEAQRLVNDLNRVLHAWTAGDLTHLAFSRDLWPTEPYDDTDDNLTLYSVINRFFTTMGVAHNSDDLTFVLYSKT